MQAWARRRARQGGLPQPARVALVSAVSGSGVPGLLRMLHEEVGGRGDVWVVRAPGRALWCSDNVLPVLHVPFVRCSRTLMPVFISLGCEVWPFLG